MLPKITFSFIIPHRNSPKLLERCIGSIPDQENIEIIVVDDCSDSDHKHYLQKIVDSNQQVTLVQLTENKGAGNARNIGMLNARGNWLIFADADDYYTLEILDILNNIGDKEIDIIYFNASTDNPSFKRTARLNDYMDNYSSGQSESIKDIMYKYWVPWNKIFSRDFVIRKNLLWQLVPVGNDARFVLYAGSQATKISIFNKVAYVHTMNKNGITYSKKTFEQELLSLRINLSIINFLKTRRVEILDLYRSIFGKAKLTQLLRDFGLVKTLYYLTMALRYNFSAIPFNF